MANRSKRTEKATERFLEAVRQGASITKAADLAGVGRRTAYEWREEDADFAQAWDDALEAWTDELEDEATRRAHEGVATPHFFKGQVCGHAQRFSDSLMIFMLRARRPEKYRDQVEHSGSIDVGLAKLLAAIDGKTRGIPGK